jgi:hypothetical protein
MSFQPATIRVLEEIDCGTDRSVEICGEEVAGSGGRSALVGDGGSAAGRENDGDSGG